MWVVFFSNQQHSRNNVSYHLIYQNKNFHDNSTTTLTTSFFNRKSTGLFALGTALRGEEGVFSVKLDPDILESGNFQD